MKIPPANTLSSRPQPSNSPAGGLSTRPIEKQTATRAPVTNQTFVVTDVQKLSSQDIQRLRNLLSDEQLTKTLRLSQNETASLKTRAEFEKLTVQLAQDAKVAKASPQNTNTSAEQSGNTKTQANATIFITRDTIAKGQNINLSNQVLESQPTKNTPLNTLSTAQQKTLVEALRHYIPQQRALGLNLKDLSALNTALNSLGSSAKNQILSKNTSQALELVLKNVLTAKTEIKPETIIQRFKNAGIFLESNIQSTLKPKGQSATNLSPSDNKVNNTVAPPIINNPSSNKSTEVSKSTLDTLKSLSTLTDQISNALPLKKTEAEALIPKVSTTHSKVAAVLPSQAQEISLNKVIATRQQGTSSLLDSTSLTQKNITTPKVIAEQDLKAALLQLLFTLGVNPAVSTNHITSKPSHAIDALIQAFLRPSKSQEQQQKTQESIQNQIKKVALSALSRLITLQLQNLHRQSTDGGLSINQTLEIPMKLGDHFTPIVLHIEQQDPFLNKRIGQDDTDEKDSNEDSNKKQSQWSVFLEFDFADDSKFSCEINVIGNTVTSSLWAENSELRKKLTKQLPELEQELTNLGVEVDSLRCVNNQPVRQANTVRQNIVDIKT